MNYTYKAVKSDDKLTVEVTLPALDKYEKSYKIDSQKVLVDLIDKYRIISCLTKCTLEARHDEEVSGTLVFKIPKPTKRVKDDKPKRQSSKAVETKTKVETETS